jgi:hypothetical protein
VNVFKTAALRHFRAVQQCLQAYRGEATVNMADLVLQLRARNRYYTLYPRFLGFSSGQLRYTVQLDDAAHGFCGWLPYFNKRWPTGSGKFTFKEFCRDHGLRTPEMWRSPSSGMRDFLVKHNNASFGQALRGPFATYDARDAAQAIDQHGYYEAFIRGRVLKATYWDGRLGCVEIKDMPAVTGDGRSSLRALVKPRLHFATPESEWQTFASLAAYQDLALDAVPAAGRSVLVDYRYGSYASPLTMHNTNALGQIAGSTLHAQLVECGQVLWRSIPEAQRPATLFTVDAVVDERDQAWLLEMNCNPVLHPDAYALMFETLFGPAEISAELEMPAPPPVSALPTPAMATARQPVPAVTVPLAAASQVS